MKDARSPLVSIITPTFNHEKFIGKCIDSVLPQTYENWEQIIIDDGSTDHTGAIVRSYSDPRVRYFYEEHQGIDALANTYNRALSLARGTLIAILEGDDFWPPEKLATLVPKFNDPSLILAYGMMPDVDASGEMTRGMSRTTHRRAQLPRAVLSNDPVGCSALYMVQPQWCALIPACTAIIRRGSLEAIGGFHQYPGFPAIDYPTFLELTMLGKFHYENSPMAFHRRHLDAVTVREADPMSALAVEVSRRFMDMYGDRIGLISEDRRRIIASWERAKKVAQFSHGQFMLARGEWKAARTHFCEAMKVADFRVRSASTLGWVASWFHSDIEFLMRLTGRASLQG